MNTVQIIILCFVSLIIGISIGLIFGYVNGYKNGMDDIQESRKYLDEMRKTTNQ